MRTAEPLPIRMIGWIAKLLLLIFCALDVDWISAYLSKYDSTIEAYAIFCLFTCVAAACMLVGRLRWLVVTISILGILRAVWWILTSNYADGLRLLPTDYFTITWVHYYLFSIVVFLLALFYTVLPREQSEEIDAPAPTQSPALTEQNWHAWLLASLRSTGVRRLRRDPYWYIVAPVIAAFCLTGFMMVLVAFVQSLSSGPDRQLAFYLWLALIPLSIFVVSRIYNRLLRVVWQARARSAERELMRSNSRRPVLYLRSFTLDEKLARASWIARILGTVPLANAEQSITKVLRKRGPVIAIGRPGETLPQLGAARFYVTDALWKSKVEDVARVAQLIVWATGLSEGLRWELNFLIRNVPPEKLVIWAHPHLLRLDEEGREREWRAFRAALGGQFPNPLPERLGDVRFFYFRADRQPIGVGASWSFGANARALRAVLGQTWHPS
jgi:hypothetical protein